MHHHAQEHINHHSTASAATPLIVAAQMPRHAAAMAECLVRHGANLRITDNSGFSPLHYALLHQQHSVADVLQREARQRGELQGILQGEATNMTVAWAVLEGHCSVLSELCRLGVNLHEGSWFGITALELACMVRQSP